MRTGRALFLSAVVTLSAAGAILAGPVMAVAGATAPAAATVTSVHAAPAGIYLMA
jgi:hypothetical protein